jgi:hypothetical protein
MRVHVLFFGTLIAIMMIKCVSAGTVDELSGSYLCRADGNGTEYIPQIPQFTSEAPVNTSMTWSSQNSFVGNFPFNMNTPVEENSAKSVALPVVLFFCVLVAAIVNNI